MEIRKARSRSTRMALRGIARLTLWHKLIRDRLAAAPAHGREPSRIALFASMQLLGGGVLISAVVKTLRELYPRASIYVVGERHRSGKLEAFFQTHSWVDGMIYCPVRGGATFAEWWRFYRELKAYRFDMCVLSPNHSCSNSVFLYLCGVPHIVGAYLPEAWPWHDEVENRFLTGRVTNQLISQKSGMLLQFPQAYARMLTGRHDFGISALVPYLRFTDEGLPPPLAHRPLVTMHPGGPPNRRWRPDGFEAIGRMLIRRYGAAICIVGGQPEAEAADRIGSNIARECSDGDVVNGCGASTNQTLTYLAHSSMFLGNGAGPMQLALALGVPVVGLLLESEYGFAAPDAAGSQHRAIARERLEDVSVSEVWAAIESQGALVQPRHRSTAS